MARNRCWVEISKQNYLYNVKALKDYLPSDTGILAIIKANGYGHGAVKLAGWLAEAGVNDYGVACIDEAEELRYGNIGGNILILSYVDESEWERVMAADCHMSVVSLEHAEKINEWGKQHNCRVKVEIKVDTGMRRLGINEACSEDELRHLYSLPNLDIKGTFTHLSCADSFAQKDREFTLLQNMRFAALVDKVKAMGLETGRCHLGASSCILNYPEIQYDFVRPGFVLLGYDVGEVEKRYERKPVLSFYSRVEQVKEVKGDEGISYGRIYFTDKTRKIATVCAGYADGYPRRLSNIAYVLIRGQKAPVVGRICMDQFMVDVTDIPDVQPEDTVTLIGKNGNEEISVEMFAEWANTVGSDIVCGISPRVKRYYRE